MAGQRGIVGIYPKVRDKHLLKMIGAENLGYKGATAEANDLT